MSAPILPSTPTAYHGLEEHAALPVPAPSVRPLLTAALVGAVLLGLVGILTGCTPAEATPPQRLTLDAAAWRDSLSAWRTQRLREIAGPTGWSTVTGLIWLDERERWQVGTDSTADVRLALEHAPTRVGIVSVEGGTVRFTAAPDAAVAQVVRNPAATGATGATLALVDTLTLHDDKHDAPTVLAAGSVTIRLIERGGRLALRVKDSLAEARVHFAGLTYFPDDSAWRVPAQLIAGAPDDSIAIINILGQTEHYFSPGILHFTANGVRQTLRAVREPGDTARLFVLFRDATSADATYPAGRFVHAPSPGADGWTVLDFNRAYNPPCAFTTYATCPLPPRENVLKPRIEAGERRYAGAHPVAVAVQ